MTKSKKSIAVVGCGWLGLPFAEKMLERRWLVKGSTTQKEKLSTLENLGIKSYLVNLHERAPLDSTLFSVDYLLINVPPGRGDSELVKKYPNDVDRLLYIAGQGTFIKKIIFISSTSVYSKAEDLIDERAETKPESEAGKAILGAEESVMRSGMPYVILRLGGLAGPKRHPGRFLAGRNGLTSGNQSINFLHSEDAIGVVMHILDHQIENEVFNVAAPLHPTKKEFYTKMANSIGLMPPNFLESSDLIKREVSVRKLLDMTGYRFRYPNPLDFSL